MLAVSTGDNCTKVFEQSNCNENEWIIVTEINESG